MNEPSREIGVPVARLPKAEQARVLRDLMARLGLNYEGASEAEALDAVRKLQARAEQW